MSEYNKTIDYLISREFECISIKGSNIKIFVHEDGTKVKVEK